MDDDEPFVCDECGRQSRQAEGTNWCVNCESEYQAGLSRVVDIPVPWPKEW
jgi:hypothetical protein